MANIWEKAFSILAGNLNSGLSYLITAVSMRSVIYLIFNGYEVKHKFQSSWSYDFNDFQTFLHEQINKKLWNRRGIKVRPKNYSV